MQNLITDVAGLSVGQAHSERHATGVTVVVFDEPAVASAATLGGGPGQRDTALLHPEMTVERVDAFVLGGGSAFGLDAAGGVMAALAEQGRGFLAGTQRVPIVPQAILFDLMNGGDKSWGRKPPFFDLGLDAVEAISRHIALGTAGAGYGCTTANLKGGLGSASAVSEGGHVVGAIVAVNAVGTTTIGDGPHFWAAPYETNCEFGGLGWPAAIPPQALSPRLKGGPGQSTTVAVLATDAILTKAQARRLALAGHNGLSRAIRPAHTPLDGDTVLAASTGRRPLADPVFDLTHLLVAAADCLARAIARGVFEATRLPFPDAQPAWRDRYGRIMVSP